MGSLPERPSVSLFPWLFAQAPCSALASSAGILSAKRRRFLKGSHTKNSFSPHGLASRGTERHGLADTVDTAPRYWSHQSSTRSGLSEGLASNSGANRFRLGRQIGR